MTRSRILGLAFALALVACKGEEATSTSAEDIRGGEVARNDPGIVMVHFATGQFCSGTLVAPDRVLTAAHCLKYVADKVYVGVGVPTTPSDQVTSTRTMKPYPVAGQAQHPDYLPYVQRNGFDRCPVPVPDLAVVRLAQPILDVTPVKLAAAMPKQGDVCRSIGFGAHRVGADEYTYQEKRTARESISEIRANAVKTRWVDGVSDKGDSGGALVCGTELVGVTSCHDDDPDARRYEIYARFDVAAAWLGTQGVPLGAPTDGGAPIDAGR